MVEMRLWWSPWHLAYIFQYRAQKYSSSKYLLYQFGVIDLWPLLQLLECFLRYCGCETIPAGPCFCCTFFAISFYLHFSRGSFATAAIHLETSTATEVKFVGQGYRILATVEWHRWLFTSVIAFACWVSAHCARRAIRSCASRVRAIYTQCSL